MSEGFADSRLEDFVHPDDPGLSADDYAAIASIGEVAVGEQVENFDANDVEAKFGIDAVREALAQAVPGRPPVVATPYAWRDPESLPRRPWIYGYQLLRGCVFVLIAPGATGKSSLLAGMSLAMCTGRELLEEQVWGGPKRVWIWNLEDPLSELQFSIQAAALHFGLRPADLDGRLFVDSGIEGATLKLARQSRDGPQIDQPVANEIVAEIRRREIDVLIIDPFISSHGLNDENDNAGIDMVAKEWARIANAADCAVVLAHHSRKLNGGEVTAESSRGASSLVDAARGGRALNPMTKDEADRMGVDQKDRRRFFRSEDAKPNRAPPGAGEWFQLVSVTLGNGNCGGDCVGVATKWKAPDAFDGVSVNHLKSVQAKIADGEYRQSVQSPAWAGKVVAEVLDLDLEVRAEKRRATEILDQWIKNGALKIEERRDKKGELRPFVIVGSVA